MSANQSTQKRRRVNGDGSVYKRQQDSYWVGAEPLDRVFGALGPDHLEQGRDEH